MRVSITVGAVGAARDDWEDVATFVQEAERLGVHSVWSAEAWGNDAVTPLAYLAAKTTRIMLGTGIMQAGTRTPALVAMTAMTMESLSQGRFIVGLGASGPQVIEGWHGIPFKQPLQRMREIIEIMRLVSSGERVSYKGKIYELPLPGGEGKPLRASSTPREHIPVYLATLGPKSLEMTGELADGWLGTSFMPEHADVFFDHIRAGAERAGRSFDDIDLQAGGTVAFSDDVDGLIQRRKQGLAFTLGAMGSRQHNFYNAAFQRAGYQDVAVEVQKLWLDGKRDEAAQRVPDELAVKTNLLGTEDMVKERLRTYRDAGVITLRVDPIGRNVKERLETLARTVDLVNAVNQEATPAHA
ncbi:MAG: LLM class F420-dependent oxidoreductase [Dehalococcoidia bacterium]